MADEEQATDQTLDSIEPITDQTPQTNDQTETIKAKVDYQTVAELLKRFNIKKAALYERINFLEIQSSKGKKGQSLFNIEQVAELDRLDEHIKRTGKMDNFPKAQALSTEPSPEQLSPEQTQALVVTKDTSIGVQKPNDVVEPIPIQPVISQADIYQIKSNAAARVKNLRLAEIEVARAMQENPDLLPEEIKREIAQAEMEAISTPLSHRHYYDPKALAQAAIASL